jgi:hypothetical protein
VDEDAIAINKNLNITCPIGSISSQSKLRRWKKCSIIINNFMVKFDSILQHFDVEE